MALKYAPKGLTFPGKDYLEHILAGCSDAAQAGRKDWRMRMSERKNSNGQLDRPTRRQAIVGVAMACGGLALSSTKAWAGAEEEISHTAESIHQEPVFKASRKRVYEALTDAKQFEKVVQLSGAMKSGMAPGAKPAEISHEAGGAFALFGGYVTGRHLELVPNERIVQAWRAGSWDPGDYSIAKFQLVEQGAGTKIVFDHTGFPKGQAEHLAAGWKMNYWEPLQKILG
jgi:activator of HSP90 ATPase